MKLGRTGRGQQVLFDILEITEKSHDPVADALELAATPCHDCRLGIPYPENSSLLWRGSMLARIALVSKHPGAREMKQGAPMVGKGGQELDRWMRFIGLDTSRDAFIVNVVQCATPTKEGRHIDPKYKGEVDRCFPRVQKVLNSLPNLEVIVGLGVYASNVLLGEKKPEVVERDLHGTWFETEVLPGKALFCLPHPADFVDEMSDGEKYGRLMEDLACFRREYLETRHVLGLIKR